MDDTAPIQWKVVRGVKYEIRADGVLLNRRRQPLLDERVGVRSKYWTFECGSRAEFEHDMGLYRLKLRRKRGVFAYWRVDGGSARGYVEYRSPVTENAIRNYHGNDLSVRVSTELPRMAPEGFKMQRFVGGRMKYY